MMGEEFITDIVTSSDIRITNLSDSNGIEVRTSYPEIGIGYAYSNNTNI